MERVKLEAGSTSGPIEEVKGGCLEGVEATNQPEAAVELRPKYSPRITSGQTEGAWVHPEPFYYYHCGFTYSHVHNTRKMNFL